MQRRDLPLLVCVLVVLGLQVAALVAMDTLRYDRGLVLDGQWWRLITGHFIHVNWAHALMDLAALMLLRLAFPRARIWYGWCFPVAVAGFALGISGLFVYFDPRLAWYVGLSGVLHALAAFVALTYWRYAPVQTAFLLAGLVVKLYFEQAHGPSALSASLIGAPVISAAHLYGAVLGGVAGAAVWAACSMGIAGALPILRLRRGDRRE